MTQSVFNPEALFAKAAALAQAGKLNEAAAVGHDLLASYPDNISVLNLLAMISDHKGDYAASIKLYEKIIALQPGYAPAYNSHGIALCILRQFDKAIESFDKAIAINPSNDEAYTNRSNALYELKRFDDALTSCGKAIAINSRNAVAYNTRAIALQSLYRYDESLAACDNAIAIRPDYAEAYHTRAITLRCMKRYDEAFANFDKAIAISPTNASIYFHKALLKLLLGGYEEGWKLYEWRWRRADIDKEEIRSFEQPLWLGKESLNGKTLLLHAEQGMGDALQFCRYVPLVEAMGAKVVIEVPTALADFINTVSKTAQIISRGTPLPDFDFYCPFMSLPLAFRTMVNTIPARIPYLFADSGKQNMWQERLGVKRKPRIGLVWSGRAAHTNDHNRSIALSLLAPLFEMDYDFISLQKEIKPSDEAILTDRRVISYTNDLKEFSDTAALVSELDLVISVDTSVAHLAGALGKPVWVLLPHIPDFRWLLEREDSPWYPTARLFRQPSAGDWSTVIAEVKESLLIVAGAYTRRTGS